MLDFPVLFHQRVLLLQMLTTSFHQRSRRTVLQTGANGHFGGIREFGDCKRTTNFSPLILGTGNIRSRESSILPSAGHLLYSSTQIFSFIVLELEKMLGWHHRLNGPEFEQAPGEGEGQGSLASCSPWGRKESGTTERLNSNKFKLT